MKFQKIILTLAIIFSLIGLKSCAPQNHTKIFKDEKFTIEYPEGWLVTNENKILNFYPVEDYGSVTISSDSGIDFPLEKTRDFLLDMSQVKDEPSKVRMTKSGNVTTFYYEHIEKNIKWITKAFRKNSELYLITINCELNNWEANKDDFMRTLNSFKLD